jgi:hypothetical protein
MADIVYNKGKYTIARGLFADGSTTFSCLIIAGASVPGGASSVDLDFVSELLAVGGVTEMAGTGYVRKSLGSLTRTEDDTNDRVALDAANVTWTAIDAGTARALVTYKDGGADSSRELLSFHDTNFPKVTNGGDLTVTISDLIWLQ